MNKQKLLALISHVQYETPYMYGDATDDLIEALTSLLDYVKPSEAFKRYYLYNGESFLHTALSKETAVIMANEYLKVFPKYDSIRITTLDGHEEIIWRC